MDKTMLVRLSDKISFNPEKVTWVSFAPSCVYVGHGQPEELELRGEELDAFKRWHDDHSAGDYQKGGSKELGCGGAIGRARHRARPRSTRLTGARFRKLTPGGGRE